MSRGPADRSRDDIDIETAMSMIRQASHLDLPAAPPGWEYGWCVQTVMGQPMPQFEAEARTKGWEPLEKSEVPDGLWRRAERVTTLPDDRADTPYVTKPTMLAMKRRTVFADAERRLQEQQTRAAMQSVDNNIFNEDARVMADRGVVMERAERSTTITRGRRAKFQPDTPPI